MSIQVPHISLVIVTQAIALNVMSVHTATDGLPTMMPKSVTNIFVKAVRI